MVFCVAWSVWLLCTSGDGHVADISSKPELVLVDSNGAC